MNPMLSQLSMMIRELAKQGFSTAQIGQIVRDYVNSPILAAAVVATPTPLDDIALAGLKLLFPPSPPAP